MIRVCDHLSQGWQWLEKGCHRLCLEFVIILASVGNGWRKDVTDQCLEFVIILASVGNGWRKDVIDYV